MKWMGEEEAKEIKGAMMTSGGKGKEGKEKKWKEKEGETPLMGTLCITRERGRAGALLLFDMESGVSRSDSSSLVSAAAGYVRK